MSDACGILIGGSPSTGSSVLVNVLNRHPELAAGPETYLFIHPDLYREWDRYGHYLLKRDRFRGLKSIGWFRKNGADLLLPEYGWDPAGLAALLNRSASFPEFVEGYFSTAMTRKGATQWIEKSPSNSLAFPDFLKFFPEGKVIHTTRNPYDAVASLIARGHSPWYAAGAFVLNAAMALRSAEHPRYRLLRYEDWLLDPQKELRQVLNFLELDWREGLLTPSSSELGEEVRMEGWLSNEKGALSRDSIGRFARLPAGDRHQVVQALQAFELTPAYAKKWDLQHRNIRSIAPTLGYELERSTGKSVNFTLQRLEDWWSRTWRWYPTGLLHYPAQSATPPKKNQSPNKPINQ